MVEVPLVAEEEGGVVGRQLQLTQLVQEGVSVIEAVHVADAVDNDERLSPADVVVEAARQLQHKSIITVKQIY